MFSTPLAAYLQHRNIHYGWIVVAVTFLTMLVTAGAVGATGIFIWPLQQEFGWENSQISTALAVRLVFFGIMGPFAAAFMNHFGLQRVALSALTLICTGMLTSMFMTHIWQLIMLWGVVIGFGTGLTAMVLGVTVATRWFTARRGLVIGMLSASTATGQLVFLPMLASVTEHYGWRTALGIVATMMVTVIIVLILFMRDRPSDIGLSAYGDTEIAPTPPSAGGLGTMMLSPLITLCDVSKCWTFWVLFGTFFICGASTSGLVQMHFVSLCGDFGLAVTTAAGLLALMGIFDFFGTIGSGWLSDRYDSRWLLLIYYGLRGLSLIFLPYTNFSIYGLSIFAVFYGLDWLATVPPTLKLTTQHFGRERTNLVFGWIFAGHQLGAACAAYGAGFARTTYDTYLPTFYASGLLCIFAAAIVLTIGRLRREPVRTSQAAAV